MHIRLANSQELSIIEALARQIWPSTYTGIISQVQIDFMLDWMYSTKTLQEQSAACHEFYIVYSDCLDSGFMAIEWVEQQGKSELKINKLY
jgi:hypothetical protein